MASAILIHLSLLPTVLKRAIAVEAEPQERRLNDTYIVERFEELAEELAYEAPKWRDNPEATWQFALACLFGELSGYLFSITPQEQMIPILIMTFVTLSITIWRAFEWLLEEDATTGLQLVAFQKQQ